MSALGVLWNSNGEMFCPKNETPVFQLGRTESENAKSVEIFECPKCDSVYILRNFEGIQIPVGEAKKAFLINQTIGTKGSKAATAVEGFNDTILMVSKGFAGTTARELNVASFTGILAQRTKPGAIGHSLDVLNKRGLLKLIHARQYGQNQRVFRFCSLA